MEPKWNQKWDQKRDQIGSKIGAKEIEHQIVEGMLFFLFTNLFIWVNI